jgi:hypothetical protein
VNRLRVTHTVALLEVSEATFKEIAEKLREALYDHAFSLDGKEINMSGIGLVAERRQHDEESEACWCGPTIECPTCGLGPYCKDEDHVHVIIHKQSS